MTIVDHGQNLNSKYASLVSDHGPLIFFYLRLSHTGYFLDQKAFNTRLIISRNQ